MGWNDGIVIADEKVIQIFVDADDTNYDGISIAAEAFAEDVCLICGKKPQIITDRDRITGSTVLIISTMTQNVLIRDLVKRNLIDISRLNGKWECYKTQVIENPFEGISQAVVIVGSDKRGCIYGIYRISELIGVSPWVWFADVAPEKKDRIELTAEELNYTSKEPSVKYRGIFINDEYPSFSVWANEKYGGLNEKMYCHVFELILRLKGNYFWPAMWGNVFSEEGFGSENQRDPYANIKAADAYGIVMGTSHHEPLCRAGEEWRHNYTKYAEKYDWNFRVNEKAITNFWRDGLKRNKDYENVITMGMRGEADSALDGGLAYNIQLLKDIIIVQKQLLKEAGLEDAPQMLVVYKEVEKYWNGGIDEKTGETVPGLKHWREEDGTSPLDSVTIMLCEDNYGNVRSLPVTKNMQDRKGGWGMYYHVDYNGGPRGYMWLNVMQLEKTWEQLSEAYDFGIQDIWILNVGDLKPMELQMSYYMDLAYDFEKYGTNCSITPGDYYLEFVKKQFHYGVPKDALRSISHVLSDYCKLNAMCKPEYARENVYSLDHYAEAQRMLKFTQKIKRKANTYKEQIPEALKDAYYQLVYYPAVASANITELYIFAAMNQKCAANQDKDTNGYAKLLEESIAYDKELQAYYNNEMSSGKWKNMMNQTHYGYVSWNTDHAEPPVPVYLEQYSKDGYDKDLLIKRLIDEIPEVDESIGAKYATLNGVTGAYVEKDGYISMKAENFVSQNTVLDGNGNMTSFKIIPNYGRESGSIKVFPVSMAFIDVKSQDSLPYVEYRFIAEKTAEYTMRTYSAPSNNLDGDVITLRYGISLDRDKMIIADSLPEGFVAGDYFERHWCEGVAINAHVTDTKIAITEGVHSLRIYGIDPGFVLQKIVLFQGELPKSYLGPSESYRIL